MRLHGQSGQHLEREHARNEPQERRDTQVGEDGAARSRRSDNQPDGEIVREENNLKRYGGDRGLIRSPAPASAAPESRPGWPARLTRLLASPKSEKCAQNSHDAAHLAHRGPS